MTDKKDTRPTVHLKLSPARHARLKRLAASSGLTLNAWIAQAIATAPDPDPDPDALAALIETAIDLAEHAMPTHPKIPELHAALERLTRREAT